jgi:hypothetical protein
VTPASLAKRASRTVIDVVGDLGHEGAQRIVGQRGQMDHRVDAAQVLRTDIAQIDRESARVARVGTEYAVGEEPGVQTGDLMARFLQRRHHHGAEVALVAGDQHTLRHAAPRCGNASTVFSAMNASACGLRHCTPRSLDSPRNELSSNQSRPAWDG